jgi:hypothetical protein
LLENDYKGLITMSWTAAASLRLGDELLSKSGKRILVSKINRSGQSSLNRSVYNFEVVHLHNYFVGLNTVWVHNSSSLSTEQMMGTMQRLTIGRNEHYIFFRADDPAHSFGIKVGKGARGIGKGDGNLVIYEGSDASEMYSTFAKLRNVNASSKIENANLEKARKSLMDEYAPGKKKYKAARAAMSAAAQISGGVRSTAGDARFTLRNIRSLINRGEQSHAIRHDVEGLSLDQLEEISVIYRADDSLGRLSRERYGIVYFEARMSHDGTEYRPASARDGVNQSEVDEVTLIDHLLGSRGVAYRQRQISPEISFGQDRDKVIQSFGKTDGNIITFDLHAYVKDVRAGNVEHTLKVYDTDTILQTIERYHGVGKYTDAQLAFAARMAKFHSEILVEGSIPTQYLKIEKIQNIRGFTKNSSHGMNYEKVPVRGGAANLNFTMNDGRTIDFTHGEFFDWRGRLFALGHDENGNPRAVYRSFMGTSNKIKDAWYSTEGISAIHPGSPKSRHPWVNKYGKKVPEGRNWEQLKGFEPDPDKVRFYLGPPQQTAIEVNQRFIMFGINQRELELHNQLFSQYISGDNLNDETVNKLVLAVSQRHDLNPMNIDPRE